MSEWTSPIESRSCWTSRLDLLISRKVVPTHAILPEPSERQCLEGTPGQHGCRHPILVHLLQRKNELLGEHVEPLGRFRQQTVRIRLHELLRQAHFWCLELRCRVGALRYRTTQGARPGQKWPKKKSCFNMKSNRKKQSQPWKRFVRLIFHRTGKQNIISHSETFARFRNICQNGVVHISAGAHVSFLFFFAETAERNSSEHDDNLEHLYREEQVGQSDLPEKVFAKSGNVNCATPA